MTAKQQETTTQSDKLKPQVIPAKVVKTHQMSHTCAAISPIAFGLPLVANLVPHTQYPP